MTNKTSPFTAVISGIPGASLSATSGTAPATINVILNPASLTPGTYHGFVGVNAPAAINFFEIVPITITVEAP